MNQRPTRSGAVSPNSLQSQPRIDSPDQANAERLLVSHVSPSDETIRTGRAGVQSRIDALSNRAVNRAFRQRFANHQFGADAYHSFISGFDEEGTVYRQLLASTPEQIRANPRIYVNAMFPIDAPTRNSFVVDGQLLSALAGNQNALSMQAHTLNVLLPSLGLCVENGRLCTKEHFSLQDCTMLHSPNGRKRLAQIIRSLWLFGNKDLAINLRDLMYSIARRYEVPIGHMVGVLTACEEDHFAILQRGWRTEKEAVDIMRNVNFGQSRPLHGILEFDPNVGPYQYVATGDPFADFVLGHIESSRGDMLDDVVQNTDFSALGARSRIFSTLFPTHEINPHTLDEPIVTEDTALIFEKNPYLRMAHRELTKLALQRFGIELTEEKTTVLSANFNDTPWIWLNHDARGEKERALLLRIIKSLYLLGSQEIALSLQANAVACLSVNNILCEDFQTALDQLAPAKVEPEPTAPALPSIEKEPAPRKRENYLPFFAAVQSEEVEDLLRKSQIDSDNFRYDAAKLSCLLFPVDYREAPMREAVRHDASITQALSDPNNQEIANRQLAGLDALLGLCGLARTGTQVRALRLFNADEFIFTNDPHSLPRIFLRILRSLYLTGQNALMESLRDTLMRTGLRSQIDRLSLAHFFYAPTDVYRELAGEINSDNASDIINPVLQDRYRDELAPRPEEALPAAPLTPPPHLPLPRTLLPAKKPPRPLPVPQIRPEQNFGFQGEDVERFEQYLTSELFRAHLSNLFTAFGDSWAGVVAWVFPLVARSRANAFAPTIDEDIANLIQDRADIRAVQKRLLDEILRYYGIVREKNAFFATPEFDLATNDLFSNRPNNPAALIFTRILRHLFLTERDEMALNLQAFLMTHGLESNINAASLAHWHLSSRLSYDRDVLEILPQHPNAAENLREILAAAESIDYERMLAVAQGNLQERPVTRPEALSPPPPPRPPVPAPRPRPAPAPEFEVKRYPPRQFADFPIPGLPQILVIPEREVLDFAQAGLKCKIDLNKFRVAQAQHMPTALREIRAGFKATHWMWYIFPQVLGLGLSDASQRMALKNRLEIQAFLLDHELKNNLEILIQAVMDSGKTPREIFGIGDDAKFWACLTAFSMHLPAHSTANTALQLFFNGVNEPNTERLLVTQDRMQDEQAKRERESQPPRFPSPEPAPPRPASPIRARSPVYRTSTALPWTLTNRDGALNVRIPPGDYDYSRAIVPIIHTTPAQPVSADPSDPLGHIYIDEGNIADAGDDIVVNAANTRLRGGTGVDGAIHNRAGAGALVAEMSARYPVIDPRTGNACHVAEACTSHPHGFAQQGVKYLIHVAGPRVVDYARDRNNITQADVDAARADLEAAYKAVLDKAKALNARSVALPLLSSGVFGYPPDQAAAVALNICSRQEYKDLKITFYTLKALDRPGQLYPTQALKDEIARRKGS